jgi:hypothetical protein
MTTGCPCLPTQYSRAYCTHLGGLGGRYSCTWTHPANINTAHAKLMMLCLSADFPLRVQINKGPLVGSQCGLWVCALCLTFIDIHILSHFPSWRSKCLKYSGKWLERIVITKMLLPAEHWLPLCKFHVCLWFPCAQSVTDYMCSLCSIYILTVKAIVLEPNTEMSVVGARNRRSQHFARYCAPPQAYSSSGVTAYITCAWQHSFCTRLWPFRPPT